MKTTLILKYLLYILLITILNSTFSACSNSAKSECLHEGRNQYNSGALGSAKMDCLNLLGAYDNSKNLVPLYQLLCYNSIEEVKKCDKKSNIPYSSNF